MTRTINSPGFELHEIDKSQYNRTVNNSLQKAPVCFLLGYADKGEDYVPQWINIKNTFVEYYGNPTSEKERYFYNTAIEILNNGGICIAAKLPYENEQKQKYTFSEYEFKDILSIDDNGTTVPTSSQYYYAISSIYEADSSIKKFLPISNKLQIESETTSIPNFNSSGTMSNVELDAYLSKSSVPSSNTIRFVDISHSKYSKTYVDTVKHKDPEYYSNDCLGIIPTIVTPSNALYFQSLLKLDDNLATDFNNISGFVPCYSANHTTESGDISIDTSLENISASLYMNFQSNDKNITTVSKNTIDIFPTITWKTQTNFDRKYLKSIGVVVLKAFTDQSNNNTINFSIVESFVGTLDYAAAQTDPSISYIDDVVNQNSNYIRMFTNISKDKIDQMNTTIINHCRTTSLGFYDVQCEKTLTSSSEIMKDMNIALSKVSNNTTQQIDLVVDAGITNIVQETHFAGKTPPEPWKLESSDDTTQWILATEIFDNFCKRTRKDCMFICDGLRTLCLNNNQKIVNPILNVTVQNSIIPKFKFMKSINSSYSAGYCNWFLTYDYYSNQQFWMPPSGKVVKSYINCSTYYHTWDAPAGIIRGKLDNIIDVAFNPNQKEADLIYLNGWNYAINYPIEGTVVEGQKTFQTEETALDRINVRRLMLYLERSVMSLAKYFLYEHNTAYNRQRFVDTITPIFENAKSGFGLKEYVIKCGDDINTTETIERNELHVKIAIKPIKTIEYIVISYVLTNQSASVQEEVLK